MHLAIVQFCVTKSSSHWNIHLFSFQKSTPTQYFWYRTTLMVSEDINHPGQFNWKIAVTLVIAWILVYLCMIKGITSSGKVRSVTVHISSFNTSNLSITYVGTQYHIMYHFIGCVRHRHLPLHRACYLLLQRYDPQRHVWWSVAFIHPQSTYRIFWL